MPFIAKENQTGDMKNKIHLNTNNAIQCVTFVDELISRLHVDQQ